MQNKMRSYLYDAWIFGAEVDGTIKSFLSLGRRRWCAAKCEESNDDSERTNSSRTSRHLFEGGTIKDHI